MIEGGEGERGGGYEDCESLEVVRWWWSSGISVFWSKSNNADHVFSEREYDDAILCNVAKLMRSIFNRCQQLPIKTFYGAVNSRQHE